MDLGAYTQIGLLEELLPSQPPRIRGLRLMRFEEEYVDDSAQGDMFNSFLGQDILYIHTRCGSCGDDYDPDYNYISCGLRDWEEAHADLLVGSINDDFDCTYRDTYITIPADKQELYNKMVKAILEGGPE